MNIISIIILTVLSINCYSQIDSVYNEQLFNYAKNAPKDLNNITELGQYLSEVNDDPQDKIEVVYYWITQNIQYDYELQFDPKNYEKVKPENVFKTRKTICAGYSYLICELAKIAEVECEIISGMAQGFLDPAIDTLIINHAWNAVKLNGDWKLIDATWGSGGIRFGSKEFEQQLDMRYFLGTSDFFIIDHFPENINWQLLNKPITFQEFQGKESRKMRMRKFNNLLDDQEYQDYLEMLENNKNLWEQKNN